MKKLKGLRSLIAVAIFTMLATSMSGCYSYGYNRPHYRPYGTVYARPLPPPRYHHYGHGGYYNRW